MDTKVRGRRKKEPGKEGSAVDRVTAEVRRSMLNGAMPPGTSFSITELGERLGVSHIPVREALRRLDAQGLIILRPGRSAIVGPLDVDELRGIYRLRRLLEPGLAAKACPLLSEQDLSQLEALLTAYGKRGHDAEQLWQIHHDIHAGLVLPAASTWDQRILVQLWHASDRYTRIVFDTYNVSDGERKRRHDAHRLLLAAAQSKSPHEIRLALESHLDDNEAACLVGLAAYAHRTQ